MRIVLFARNSGDDPAPGVLVDGGVVPLPRHGLSPQAEMVWLIDHFEDQRANLERLAATMAPVSKSEVQLQPPLPRPGKILCSTATYNASRAAERRQLLFTLKSAESVIGPGQSIQLPDAGVEWQFQPEAELGLIIRGPARNIAAADWQRAVFGYTCVIDVMASGDTQFGRDFWLAKSDTLGPLGPHLVTADEVAQARRLRVRSWVNAEVAQDYAMADADYSIGEQIELATTIMTLETGDVLACGTSRDGLRPVAGGDDVQVDIGGVGRLQVRIAALSGLPT
jgi:2-keto-4-pentenoate hydratase/2-oxohepta-3-ene-1,7-dioic acid hydratase in catechol pathway